MSGNHVRPKAILFDLDGTLFDRDASFLELVQDQYETLSDRKMKLSARATIDYLTGRIDKIGFEPFADAWNLSLLRKALDQGGAIGSNAARMPTTITLVIEWNERDPAITPFTTPETGD